MPISTHASPIVADAVFQATTAVFPQLPFDLAQLYALDVTVKKPALLAAMNQLTHWHTRHCEQYAEMVRRLFAEPPASSLENVPFLPVRLFKTMELRSVAKADIIKTLTSSGTTGQAVSRIFLDRETSIRQTRVLGAIMASFLGKKRLPMVVIDSSDIVKDRARFNARAAGILGFSIFGRDHFYCLNEQLQLDFAGLQSYLDRHQDEPILLFGFTFIVWQGLYECALNAGVKLRFPAGSILIHGGGWKRLLDQQVDNDEFKALLSEQFGIEHVFNYYGMVEQVGSIFMECAHGHLHSPTFADVIVRDPHTLHVQQDGKSGVIQVLSALPLSYPGHSLLTEDVGVIHGEDDCPCGRMGKHFTVLGRLPQVELRGCSDTRVVA